MSVSDRTGTSKSFVLASRQGLDATYVCTNPDSGTTITISQRQTRPSKAGSVASVNVKAQVSYYDASTGNTFPASADLTIRFRNDDRATNHTERLQQAVVLAIRSLCPFDAATIVATATATNLANAELGALPPL